MFKIIRKNGEELTGFRTRQEAERQASVFDEVVECGRSNTLTDLLYS